MHSHTRRLILLTLLLLAGCGGGGGDGEDGKEEAPATPLAEDVPVDPTAPAAVASATNVKICRSGATVYAAFLRSYLGARQEIMLARSLDGGLSWDEPGVVEVNVDDDNHLSNLMLACSGARVYLAWIRNDDGLPRIDFKQSVDGGATWPPGPTRLDSNGKPRPSLNSPRMVVSGLRVYVVWGDSRNGAFNPDIYVNASADGGTTWFAEDRILNTNGLGASPSYEPDLCADGEVVCVVWTDERRGEAHPFSNRSLDGGLTWLDEDVSLVGPHGEHARVCCDGTLVHVVWRLGGDVFVNRSFSAGASWASPEHRINEFGTVAVGPAEICCSEENVYVVWSDQREEVDDSPAGTLYLDHSFNRGITWQNENTRIPGSPPGTYVTDFDICCGGQAVLVAWADGRRNPVPGPPGQGEAGETEIFARYSLDGGVSWSDPDAQVSHFVPGGVEARRPRVACDESGVAIIWIDDRSGRDDVHANAVLFEPDAVPEE